MCLLTIKYILIRNGTITAPVGHRRQGIIGDVLSHGPRCEDYGLHSRNPGQPAGWHRTLRLPDRLANGHKTIVIGEAHIYPLSCLPELIKGRVEVEIDTQW